jgi:integrase
MARIVGKLTALAVNRAKEKGLYGDGGGLYLQVGPTGNKAWIYRFMLHGKAHAMGLGAVHAVSLAEARVKAADGRKILAASGNPLMAKKSEQTAARVAAAKGTTFEACAQAYIDAHKASWRQERHAKQWSQALAKHVYPIFGKLPVQSVDTALVVKVLEPIWQKKTETAKRLRGRIECILDWAKVREYRAGENPARWRGHLENLLARPSKLIKVEHFAALPYAKINGFLHSLEKQAGLGAQALKLVILTACRSREALEATWDEIDLDNKIWAIPAERMKGGKEHRIPLTSPALTILKGLKKQRDRFTAPDTEPSHYVFPSQKGNAPLSNVVMLALLKRMKRRDITVHGFRSSFRDWAAEQTNFPREVAEAALAHAIESRVEAAYRRSDLFEKRRLLMEKWAWYCQQEQTTSKVFGDEATRQEGEGQIIPLGGPVPVYSLAVGFW